MSPLVPPACFPVLTLVAHAYFWLDANSMLSSHLFTSSCCHIFKCFPHTLFASCTVVILCTFLAFIYIFSSFTHLLKYSYLALASLFSSFTHLLKYSYLALASLFLFCPYPAHFSFSFVPCLPSYCHIISSHILCILEHYLLIHPSFHMSFPLSPLTLLYSWVFFISFSFVSPYQCSALPLSSPALHCHLP